MNDYDDFLSQYQNNNREALELLTEMIETRDEDDITAAWDLYEQTSEELELAQQLAKEEWGWEDSPPGEEEEWSEEGVRGIIFGGDPSELPGAEPRGEPFLYLEDAVAYVADIAGFAQGYFGIFENAEGGFEVWYNPE